MQLSVLSVAYCAHRIVKTCVSTNMLNWGYMVSVVREAIQFAGGSSDTLHPTVVSFVTSIKCVALLLKWQKTILLSQ